MRLALSLALLLPATAVAQLPQLSQQVQQYVSVSDSVVALTHVRVVDGTGAAAREDQTIVLRGGRIAAVGPAASTAVPRGARVVDGAGKTVIPGIVGLHNHSWYSTSGRAVQSNWSSPRLYLGSGVTTIRTTGSMSPYAELN